MSLSEEDQQKIDAIKARAARERTAPVRPKPKPKNQRERKDGELSTWQTTLGIACLIWLGWHFLGEPGGIFEKAPDYEVTAAELFRAYDTNEVAAKVKYKGKLVKVSGKFVGSGVGVGDKSYAILDVPGNVLLTVQCYFPESSEHQLLRLRKGEQVTITGVVDGKFGNVFLEDCSVP